jgi:hypothetical protein
MITSLLPRPERHRAVVGHRSGLCSRCRGGMRPSPGSTRTLGASPLPMLAWWCTRIARALSSGKHSARRGWRRGGGRRNDAKSHIGHTVEGAQPGLACLGLDIRQYRGGQHHSGQGPGGPGRLGDTTLITPAQAKVQEHLAELGRIIASGKALPPGRLSRQLTPTIRGWATSRPPTAPWCVRPSPGGWSTSRGGSSATGHAGDIRGKRPPGPSGGTGIGSALVGPVPPRPPTPMPGTCGLTARGRLRGM